jgi:hypothetical protein
LPAAWACSASRFGATHGPGAPVPASDFTLCGRGRAI